MPELNEQSRPEAQGAVSLLAMPIAGAAAMTALGWTVAVRALHAWAELASAMLDAQRQLSASSPVETAAASTRPAERGAALGLRLVAVSGETVKAKASSVGGKAGGRKAKKAGGGGETPVDRPALLAEAGSPAAMRQPAAHERPAAPDNLRAIGGIGPKLEKVLNDLGIWTYAQVAALAAEEIAWLDDRLGFGGRIDRDGWLAQARKLAAGAADQYGQGGAASVRPAEA